MGCKCNKNIVKHIEEEFGVIVFSLQYTCENCQIRQSSKKHMPKGKGFKWFSEHYDKWQVWIEERKSEKGVK